MCLSVSFNSSETAGGTSTKLVVACRASHLIELPCQTESLFASNRVLDLRKLVEKRLAVGFVSSDFTFCN